MMWSAATRQVRFSETDASGRVHFTEILKYVETAEHELLAERGVKIISEAGGWPRARVSCDYKRPLQFGDEYRVSFKTIEIGDSSVEWCFQVISGDMIVAEGQMVTVWVSTDGRAAPLEDQVREKLTV